MLLCCLAANMQMYLDRLPKKIKINQETSLQKKKIRIYKNGFLDGNRATFGRRAGERRALEILMHFWPKGIFKANLMSGWVLAKEMAFTNKYVHFDSKVGPR